MEIRQRVREVRRSDGWALVKVHRVPDRPGISAGIFGAIAEAGISVDLILQNASVERFTNVSFTVRQDEATRAVQCLKALQDQLGAAGIEAIEHLSKVEIVGTGILSDSSHVGLLFQALADAEVNVLAIGTSEVRISCLLHQDQGTRAAKALNAAFHVEVD